MVRVCVMMGVTTDWRRPFGAQPLIRDVKQSNEGVANPTTAIAKEIVAMFREKERPAWGRAIFLTVPRPFSLRARIKAAPSLLKLACV